MSDDNQRLDLNADFDLETVKNNLLKDVEAATIAAKKRKHDDRTRGVREKEKAKDSQLKMAIIGIAAVVLFGIAYWMVFVKDAGPQQSTTTTPNIPTQGQTAPVSNTPPATYYRPPGASVVPNAPVSRPSGPPPSDPVRRTPTDTYEEGPSPSGGM